MFIADDEKSDRKRALKKIIDSMMDGTASKLSELKKPAKAEIEIDAIPLEDEEGMEGEGEEMDMDMDSMDESAPSEEDKRKIAELYHRYCRD